MTLAEIISTALGIGIVLLGIFQGMKARDRARSDAEKERLREELRDMEAKSRENDINHYKATTALQISQARLDERSKFAQYKGE